MGRVCGLTPNKREMTELPPSPNISPKAIINVNRGAHNETPATRFVFCVCDTKKVSTKL